MLPSYWPVNAIQLPSGEKIGMRLVAAGRELARFAAFARHAPEIAAVDEDDLRFAQRRRVNEQRRLVGRCRTRAINAQEQRVEEQQRCEDAFLSSH